uniref:Heat shock factor binding protein 1 n=1 Tax=Eptatretus burgeri TaxID=7764 RepID=A0A8C4QM30_EPTBU
MADGDSKSLQEATAAVENILQQMQEKFQAMSDQILNRNILDLMNLLCPQIGEELLEKEQHLVLFNRLLSDLGS